MFLIFSNILFKKDLRQLLRWLFEAYSVSQDKTSENYTGI